MKLMTVHCIQYMNPERAATSDIHFTYPMKINFIRARDAPESMSANRIYELAEKLGLCQAAMKSE